MKDIIIGSFKGGCLMWLSIPLVPALLVFIGGIMFGEPIKQMAESALGIFGMLGVIGFGAMLMDGM